MKITARLLMTLPLWARRLIMKHQAKEYLRKKYPNGVCEDEECGECGYEDCECNGQFGVGA